MPHKRCCKPFTIAKCSSKLRSITDATAAMLDQIGFETDRKEICSSCYIKLTKKPKIDTKCTPPRNQPSTSYSSPGGLSTVTSFISTVPSISDTEEVSDSEKHLKRRSLVEKINTLLPELNISPIHQSKVESHREYLYQKIVNLSSSISEVVMGENIFSHFDATQGEKAKFFDEMLWGLKDKFKKLAKTSDKIQLLTALPESFPLRQIETEFNTTHYMARRSKILKKENGSFAHPGQKLGKTLSFENEKAVTDYYKEDDVSRIMPGKNDCITIRIRETKQKVQKRLLMCSLKECYQGFKIKYENFPSVKIGFSKFAMLRPKECVLPGSSGTHSVCICTIHQNVKLLIHGTKMATITDGKFSNYRDFISSALCSEAQSTCYLLQCKKCPGISSITASLKDKFEENYEDAEIIFSQWVTTDRCNLEKLSKNVDELFDYIEEKLKKFIPHYFTSFQQSNFIKNTKLELQPNELLVNCDFSENYSFIIQNEAQGYHWNNKQATIHPFVIYYKNDNSSIEHYSFIIISECLQHDAVSVNLFIKKLIEWLKIKTKFVDIPISKIYYVSDGAASQYKNKKTFSNIANHEKDFEIKCEWHFYATSHGKNACDGIGGTIKRQAARASLTTEYESVIASPKQLYEWAKSLNTIMEFAYVTDEEYNEHKVFLEARFKDLVTIKGTQSYHAFIPTNNFNEIKCKKYSISSEFVIEKLKKNR